MSADTLRRAAALMRERAEATKQTPGVWHDQIMLVNRDGHSEHDASHIASWHPAVALAVAELLDQFADFEERSETYALDPDGPLVAVARTYLGEQL